MRALGVPYAIGGGLAVNAWLPKEAVRPTVDVDLHARLTDAQIERLCELLKREGIDAFHGSDFTLGAVFLRRLVCLPDTGLDLISAREPYGAEAIAHRVRSTFEGDPADYLAPEDLILHKALAFRDRDRMDMERLVEFRGPELDLRYLEKWARALRVWRRVKPRIACLSK